MVETSRYSRSSLRWTNGIVSVCRAVLDREPQVALLHLQLRLPDDVELHRLDAERLGLAPGLVVVGRVPLDDADLAAAGRAQVAEQVVHVPLHQRHLGGQLLRREHLHRHQIVQVAHDAARRGRQGVRVPRRKVEPAADVAAEQVHHDQRDHQHADAELEPARPRARGELPAQQRAVGQREEHAGERDEVDHVAQVHHPAPQALEVGEHPDPRRDRAEAGGQTHQQRVESHQDQQEHQRRRPR